MHSTTGVAGGRQAADTKGNWKEVHRSVEKVQELDKLEKQHLSLKGPLK